MATMKKYAVILLALLASVLPAIEAGAASYDSLLPLLVDIPGWEAEPADGADASAAGMRGVTASRTYESGERRFEASILVGMQAGMSWMPDYKEGFKMETPEGVMEVKETGGFLVSSMFEKESRSGGIIVLLQDGAGNPDTGAVFAVSFEGLALEEAMKTAQRFSWAKMKEQAAKLK